MTAKVISLCDYRKSKDAEKRSRNVRGLGFPSDFSPFNGPDDLSEAFGTHLMATEFQAPIEGIKLNILREDLAWDLPISEEE
jgi:hypothetical protein